MIKKLILLSSVGLFGLLIIPQLSTAQNGNGNWNNNTQPNNQNQNQGQGQTTQGTGINLSCWEMAIAVRDNDLMAAHDRYATAVKRAIIGRRNAEVNAARMTNSTPTQRAEVIRTAQTSWNRELSNIQQAFNTDKRNIWNTFVTNRRNCNATNEDASSISIDANL